MSSNDSDRDTLVEALFSIYATAGREVTYITDRGEERPYWANRYRQALQRAVEANEVINFVERLVTQPEPSRGFGYLAAADRLDLTVEAVVLHPRLRRLFSAEAISAAEDRLEGWTGTTQVVPRSAAPDAADHDQGLTLAPGTTFLVEITVEPDGGLSLSLA